VRIHRAYKNWTLTIRRRTGTAFLRWRDVVHKLLAEVELSFDGRPSGYAGS
jgi:ribosomal protein L17